MTLIANCIRSAMYAALGFCIVALFAYPAYVGYVYADVYGADATLAGYTELLKTNYAYYATLF